MAVDVSGYIIKPEKWEGLEKMGEMREKRELKRMQMEEQRLSKRNQTANFLKDYLDPKDYLSGTAYDPIIVQSLNDLMAKGATLAADGADSSSMLMALAPGVNKVSGYSTRAKGVMKGVEDQIARLKETGAAGIDLAKLKDAALEEAFYDIDNEGVKTFNIDRADPAKNWVGSVLENKPELVGTAEGLDEFAKRSPMSKTLADVSTYDKFGNLDRQKVHLIGQNWVTPEYDEAGLVTDLVPKYEYATEAGKPVLHPKTGERVRMLDEGEFDRVMQSSLGSNLFLRGQINKAIQAEEKRTGQKIQLNSPLAKRLGRAVAYEELNKRKATTIEATNILDRPSGAQAAYNVGSTPEAIRLAEQKAAAAKRGRESVPDSDAKDPALKTNFIEAFGQIASGNPDFSGPIVDVKGRKVMDITGVLPGGGLKHGRGEDERYKSVYWDPKKREFLVETEITDEAGRKSRKTETKTEADMGPFINRIAWSNGIAPQSVRAQLDKIGYKGGKFTGAGNSSAVQQIEKEEADELKGAIDTFKSDKGNIEKLNKAMKGKAIGGNTVQSIEKTGNWFVKGGFRVNLKSTDGKATTKTFANKQELTDFLEGKQKPQAKEAPYGKEVQRDGKTYIWDSTKSKYVIKK